MDEHKPAWLAAAEREVGTREGLGKENNPVVVGYWAAAKLAWIRDDATPWCAGFANAMLESAGVRGTRAASARSFLKWGVPLESPRLGAIVVLSRPPSPWQGHVGFLTAHDAKTVTLVGGNQGDAVSYAKFPKGRVLGYRWPSTWAVPAPLAVSESKAASSSSEA